MKEPHPTTALLIAGTILLPLTHYPTDPWAEIQTTGIAAPEPRHTDPVQPERPLPRLSFMPATTSTDYVDSISTKLPDFLKRL